MTYLYPYRRGTGWRSQGFSGNRNQGANGPGGHTGFDQAMDAGQPLYAPGDGIIRNSGWLSDNYLDNGWWLTRMGGDTLVVDMVDSFRRSDSLPTFILAHCSDTTAEVGQFVRKGELVAYSGNTGTATTGPHVHIEALPPSWDFNNGVYGRVDPEFYFDEWVDDYTGLAAMGGTITPLEEGFLMALSDPDQRDMQAAVGRIDDILQHPEKFLLSLQDQRDIQAAVGRIDDWAQHPERLVGIITDSVVKAEPGVNVDAIRQAIADGLAAGIKIDVKVGD